MKLLTKEIINSMPGPQAQDGEEDPKVYVKFFSCTTNWTWYATEGWKFLHRNGEFVEEVALNYDLQEGETFEQYKETGDSIMLYGKVYGLETEVGPFLFNEFLEINETAVLGIERDMHFKVQPLSEVDPQKGN